MCWCSKEEDDIEGLEVVEADPTGRYVRYNEILGEGAFKTVYKGFDEVNCLEIAWSKIKLSDKIFKSKKHLHSACSEADLLKSLKHENIMRCFHSWADHENKTVNIITELFTSGNMTEYRKKHRLVDKKAIKNWAKQILKGLDYLHCHNPPIIHRDVKCDNIFVNGNSGKIKIGDLGLATMVQQGCTARAVGGTPEFMAPELFEEEYDQLVDIYSFGMCLLQMVTGELPYSECTNSGQIYKKVSSGIKPAALSKVTNAEVKQLIQKCLGPVSERPSAIELLNDPFLAPSDSGSSASSSITCFSSESLCSSSTIRTEHEEDQMELCSPAAVLKSAVIEKNNRLFKLEGKLTKDKQSVSMDLWIGECGDHAKKIQFEFLLQSNTICSVMEEMAKELEVSHKDVALITKLMEELVAELVPGYNCVLVSSLSEFQDEVDQQRKPADEAMLDNLKTDSSGGRDHLRSMFGLSDQALSNKCEDKRGSEDMRRGKRKHSKEVDKAHFRSLRKLLFFCGNRS